MLYLFVTWGYQWRFKNYHIEPISIPMVYRFRRISLQFPHCFPIVSHDCSYDFAKGKLCSYGYIYCESSRCSLIIPKWLVYQGKSYETSIYRGFPHSFPIEGLRFVAERQASLKDLDFMVQNSRRGEEKGTEKMPKILGKPTKIHTIPWKSMKFHEIPWASMTIH